MARLPDVDRDEFDRSHVLRRHHSSVDGDSFIIASIDTAVMSNTATCFAVVVFVCSVLVDVRLKGLRIATNADRFR
jgi:hypothetical protein